MSRPRRPANNEAYRRALLLPVQPWRRQWVAPVGGSPGLKLKKWVKSDEKLQWSDDEDDTALEQALGAAAEQDQDVDPRDDDDDDDDRDGNITPADTNGSFPASGAITPKEKEAKPHPLRKELRRSDTDNPEGEGEGEEGDGEEEEEEEEEEEDIEDDEEEEGEEGEIEGEGEGGEEEGEEKEEQAEADDGDGHFEIPEGEGEGEEGEEEDDAALAVPQVFDPEGFDEVEPVAGDDSLIDTTFGTDTLDHIPGLGEVAQQSLLEGESVFDHSGAIEEALGQEVLGIVHADEQEDPFA